MEYRSNFSNHQCRHTGTYSVTISNGVCSKTFTATVGYIVTPQIKEITYKDPFLTIIVQNNGNVPIEYSIDGGVTWQASNTFQVLKNTKYSIRVRNRGATCDTTAEYYTFFMANVITPNSDGSNDVIDFSEISKYGNFEGAFSTDTEKKFSDRPPKRRSGTENTSEDLFLQERTGINYNGKIKSLKACSAFGMDLLKNRD
jgi:hypothetical protein